MLLCAAAMLTSRRDKKDSTKDYEIVVGLDPITSKVGALPAPLPEIHWLAQLVIYRKKGWSRIKQSKPNILETLESSV